MMERATFPTGMELIKQEYIYFMALTETLNITKASEILGIQQAGLSKALKNLEQQRNEKLFYRTPKGLKLTESGQGLKNIIADIQKTYEASLKISSKDIIGQIKLGAHPLLCQKHLPEVIEQVHREYPKIGLNLKFLPSKIVTKQILDFEIDCGIIANPLSHPDLVLIPLADEYIGAWEMGSEPILFCNSEMIEFNQTLKKYKKFKIVTIDNYETLLEMAKFSKGTFILPSTVGEKLHIEHTKLAPVKIHLAYRFDIVKTPVFYTVTNLIKDHATLKKKHTY